MTGHALFLNLPDDPCATPTLAVVEELVVRGSRVTVVTTEEHGPACAVAGADVVTFAAGWAAGGPRGESSPADRDAWTTLRLFRQHVAPVLAARRYLADAPDVIVHDPTLASGARLLSRAWQRPAVGVSAFFVPHNQLPRIGSVTADDLPDPDHPALEAVRDEFVALIADGAVADVTGADQRSLVMIPREFQFSDELFGDHYAFVGPCIGERPGQDWRPPAGAAPIVLVVAGQDGASGGEFLRTYVAAFGGTALHAVLETGGPVPGGPVPRNVEIHAQVARLKVLERAQALVCHGSPDTVMEASYYGTPLVVVPTTPAQELVADRVVELDLGVRLDAVNLTSSNLHAAVRLVSDSERVRNSVRRMQRCAYKAGGRFAAADLIETMVERARE